MESRSEFETACKQFQSQMMKMDIAEGAQRIGARLSDDSLIVPLFGQPYRMSARDVRDQSGNKANPAVAVTLYTYLFRCPNQLQPNSDWLTFRDFKDSGPLAGYFTANTNRLIASHFSGKLSSLDKACRSLGAKSIKDDSAYDLVMTFDALPKVPLSLRFNDRDEDLPAQSVMLFQKSAEVCFDLRTMIILGTYLTGNLIKLDTNLKHSNL